MKWHRLAINPQALENVYDEIPGLESVELFSIVLERKAVRLRFDLPAFPSKPSARWHKDFNTVQIQLSFWGATNFSTQKLQSEVKVKIELNRVEKILKVVMTNSELDLRCEFESNFFRIDEIDAYQKV